MVNNTRLGIFYCKKAQQRVHSSDLAVWSSFLILLRQLFFPPPADQCPRKAISVMTILMLSGRSSVMRLDK